MSGYAKVITTRATHTWGLTADQPAGTIPYKAAPYSDSIPSAGGRMASGREGAYATTISGGTRSGKAR